MSRRDELVRVSRRSQQEAGLSLLVGALTGLGVAGFQRVVDTNGFERVIEAPLVVQAFAPTAGLVAAVLALRFLAGGASPSTADEYIKNVHERDERLPLRPVAGRLLASAFTLGSGGAMGFEGPSIYLGASVGAGLQHRLSRFFSREDTKLLMVAGAAAGVAAIFKAPATGAIFALEVPYRDDLARRMLLPAMFGAAAGYVTFVAVAGTTPLFPITGTPPFDFRDLAGAAALGVACGLGARFFSRMVRVAKSLSSRGSPVVRIGAAGLAFAGLFGLGRVLTGESVILGSGYLTIDWALEPDHALWVVLAVFVLRALATGAMLGGGGVGGLFIPLVVQGALLGRVLGDAFDVPETTLFPVLGIAAFLGAGYRVPLAAVVFVAETTGRPGFIVPGLIASAASQLVFGKSSVSAFQRATRTGHLERRFALPISAALRTDAMTVPSDATVAELYDFQISEARLRVIPVVDRSTYLGMVHAADVTRVPREAWAETPVRDILRTDGPIGDVTWTLGDALRALEQADDDRLAVLDGTAYLGIVTTGEILKLDEILEATEGPDRSA